MGLLSTRTLALLHDRLLFIWLQQHLHQDNGPTQVAAQGEVDDAVAIQMKSEREWGAQMHSDADQAVSQDKRSEDNLFHCRDILRITKAPYDKAVPPPPSGSKVIPPKDLWGRPRCYDPRAIFDVTATCDYGTKVGKGDYSGCLAVPGTESMDKNYYQERDDTQEGNDYPGGWDYATANGATFSTVDSYHSCCTFPQDGLQRKTLIEEQHIRDMKKNVEEANGRALSSELAGDLLEIFLEQLPDNNVYPITAKTKEFLQKIKGGTIGESIARKAGDALLRLLDGAIWERKEALKKLFPPVWDEYLRPSASKWKTPDAPAITLGQLKHDNPEEYQRQRKMRENRESNPYRWNRSGDQAPDGTADEWDGALSLSGTSEDCGDLCFPDELPAEVGTADDIALVTWGKGYEHGRPLYAAGCNKAETTLQYCGCEPLMMGTPETGGRTAYRTELPYSKTGIPLSGLANPASPGKLTHHRPEDKQLLDQACPAEAQAQSFIERPSSSGLSSSGQVATFLEKPRAHRRQKGPYLRSLSTQDEAISGDGEAALQQEASDNITPLAKGSVDVQQNAGNAYSGPAQFASPPAVGTGGTERRGGD